MILSLSKNYSWVGLGVNLLQKGTLNIGRQEIGLSGWLWCSRKVNDRFVNR